MDDVTWIDTRRKPTANEAKPKDITNGSEKKKPEPQVKDVTFNIQGGAMNEQDEVKIEKESSSECILPVPIWYGMENTEKLGQVRLELYAANIVIDSLHASHWIKPMTVEFRCNGSKRMKAVATADIPRGHTIIFCFPRVFP